MEEIEVKNSIVNRILNYSKDNIKTIISIIITILLLSGFYEYYKYNQSEKIKKLSIKYFNALEEINSNQDKSITLLKNISKLDNGYSIISSLKLIDISLEKNKYNEAYQQYEILLNKNKLDKIYKDLIIINAGYNLSGHIKYENILKLFDKTDYDLSPFKGHFYEIIYINSIDILTKEELSKLNNDIQSDIEINNNIKERVKKLNEFIQNK